jgi:hypothetical protein
MPHVTLDCSLNLTAAKFESAVGYGILKDQRVVYYEFSVVQHVRLVFGLGFGKYSILMLRIWFCYDTTQRSGYVIRVVQHVRLVLCYDFSVVQHVRLVFGYGLSMYNTLG